MDGNWDQTMTHMAACVAGGIQRGSMTPTLQMATPETAVEPTQGWMPLGSRVVGHGEP
jgi:hypothetical protein